MLAFLHSTHKTCCSAHFKEHLHTDPVSDSMVQGKAPAKTKKRETDSDARTPLYLRFFPKYKVHTIHSDSIDKTVLCEIAPQSMTIKLRAYVLDEGIVKALPSQS